MADIERIKRNLGKMIDQSAPESDIDAYLSTEGFTPDAFKAAVTAPAAPIPANVQPVQQPLSVTQLQDQGFLSGITNQARQGNSFGFADEVGAAGAGTGGAIGAALQGRNPIDAFSKSYDRRLGEIRGSTKAFAEQHPYASIAAQIGGGIGIAGGGAKIVSEAPTVLSAIGQGAKTGAAYGGVSGFGSGEDGLGNRLAGTAVGGLAGAALGGAIPAVGYGVGKVAQVGKRMLGLQSPEREANMLLVRALQGDELTPEQLATKIGTSGGKPVTIADLADENVRRLADQVSLQGGPGAKGLNNFLDTRQADQGGRILGDIKGSLSSSTDTYGLDANLTKLRSASAPLWEEAMNQPPVWNDHLAKFADEPVVKQGMSQGIKLARLEALAKNEPFDPAAYAVTGFNEAGDPILGGVPTWRTWQAAKEGLDQQIEAARGPFGQATKASRALTDAKNALLENLDSANPVYKQARAAWAGPSAQKDAIDVGDKFLRLDPEQIAAQTSKMSQDELAAFRVGAARALQDQVDKVKGLGDATKRIFNDNRVKDQIEAAFGKNAYLQFEDAMMTESAMARTRTAVTGNSKTAQRLLGAQDVGEQIAQDFLTGGKTGVIGGFVQRGASRARGLNGPTGKALSDILTETNTVKQQQAIKNLMFQKAAEQARQKALLAAGGVASLTGAQQAGNKLAITGQ